MKNYEAGEDSFNKTNSPKNVQIWGIVCALFVLISTYYITYENYSNSEIDRAKERAQFYKATLISALELYDYLPVVLASDPYIIQGATDGASIFLNERLEIYAKQSNVDAVYLMDSTGEVIASSNWNQEINYMGQNYAFRPYFKNAMRAQPGEMFAIGVTTKLPGYFLSEPVKDKLGNVRGVIAAKVELFPLVDSWRDSGETIYVTNSDGVIVLSSNKDWVFHTLSPLNNAVRQKISEVRQFDEEVLPSLDINSVKDDIIAIGRKEYLHHSLNVERLDWTLHYVSPTQKIATQSAIFTAIAAIPLAFLSAVYFLVRSRNIRKALVASQKDRQKLRAVNKELEHEIQERRAAEVRLERAQKDLRRASKMAALGQLSASVTHELGQPISAIQNYLAAIEISDPALNEEHHEVLGKIQAMAERMEHITRQLRFFTGGKEEKFQDFDIGASLENILDMMMMDLHASGISLRADIPNEPVTIYGHQLRIEQVIVNLVRNSMDAIPRERVGEMKLKVCREAEGVSITLCDNGTGIPPEIGSSLFEPFVTSKASGQGMGLGLAISNLIVKEHKGTLIAKNIETGGAEFELCLPYHK